MQKPDNRWRPAHVTRAPLSPPRRSKRKNLWLLVCFLLIPVLVLGSLYWFALRPLWALYYPHGEKVWAVAFAPDNHMLAVAVTDTLTQRAKQATVYIDLWNMSFGVKLHTFAGSDPLIFSPDGGTLATGSPDDHSILLWNMSSDTLRQTIVSHHQFSSLVFSPDGKTLASSSQDDHFISLWDVAHGTIIRTLSGHSAGILSLAFNRDGSLLASGSLDHTIKLWDVASGKVLHTFPNTGDISRGVNPVQFSPDGRTLASVIYVDANMAGGGTTHTGHIALWNVSSGILKSTLSGSDPFSFSPDGHTLVTAAPSSTIVIWDINSGKQLQSISFLSLGCCFPQLVAFSPDGQRLASGSVNGAVELWDPSNGQLAQTLA